MDIKNLYENTDLSQVEISKRLGISYKKVSKYITSNYSKEYRTSRNAMSYRRSKLGENNPMQGKYGKEHHNYKGLVSDNKGYLMVLKPEWYTGRKKSKHVFAHHISVCDGLGITEIPKGWCVHHCDEDPYNNDFDNLVLLSVPDHARLHAALRGATTISKESTLKWVEAHGTPYYLA